jgi:hypothetical protein
MYIPRISNGASAVAVGGPFKPYSGSAVAAFLCGQTYPNSRSAGMLSTRYARNAGRSLHPPTCSGSILSGWSVRRAESALRPVGTDL